MTDLKISYIREMLCCSNVVILIGVDGYLIRLSRSGRISTIRWNPTPHGLHVSRRISYMLITALRSAIQSAIAACWLSDWCWANTAGTNRWMTRA